MKEPMRQLVFDIGMHDGGDTAYYLHCGCRVVSVDANPAMIALVRQRFARDIEEGRLTLVHAGIAEGDHEGEFWVSEDRPELSSFSRDMVAARSSCFHRESVPLVSFQALMEKHGVPYYAKIDIEGNDHLCLNALTSTTCPQYISVEYASEAQIQRLVELGYAGFKLLDQPSLCTLSDPPSWKIKLFYLIRLLHDQSLQNRRAYACRAVAKLIGRERILKLLDVYRRRKGWIFPVSCSGPFGTALDGEWGSSDAVVRALWAFNQWVPAQLNKRMFWSDLHAKHDLSSAQVEGHSE